jgi:hypothetical protein
MKALLTILFSALLVLTQSVLPGNAAVAQAQRQCARCACGHQCCFNRSAPSAPVPATPASSSSVQQCQPAAACATRILLPPPPAAQPALSRASSERLARPVPLYQRNCAWLI